jgi:hypothetical protein
MIRRNSHILRILRQSIAGFVVAACSETTSAVLPQPPDGLTVALQNKSAVMVSWSPRPKSESVVSYLVYRDGLRIGASTTTSFVDPSPPEASMHVYAVASQSQDGIISELSATASVYAPDITAPRVVVTIPRAETTALDRLLTFTVYFSEALDAASITDQTFSVKGGGSSTTLPGTITYSASTQSVQWKSNTTLAPELRVTTTIAGVKDTAGNTMSAPFSFSLTTVEGTPPTVVSVSPADGSTNVSVYTMPTVTFSEPMTPFFFRIASLNGAPSTFGTTTFDASGKVGTYKVLGTIIPFGTYRITLPSDPTDFGSGKDLAGNLLPAPVSFTFTYGDDFSIPKILSTSPANGATGVSTKPDLLITFDHPIIRVGDYQLTIDLKKSDGTPMTGGNFTFDFNPVLTYHAPQLAAQTSYTVTVTQSYTETSGNLQSSTLTWSFTTGN